MKKKSKRKTPTGNDIQIEYDKYLGDSMYMTYFLTLKVVSLQFQSAIDDEWRGEWNGQPIWVKFTRPGWETIFSDNFPNEHKNAAAAEVKRITRQFD